MEDHHIGAIQSKRKIYNVKILLLHLLCVSTYFITIYFYNYTQPSQKHSNMVQMAFNKLSNFKGNLRQLAVAFPNGFYNQFLEDLFWKKIVFVLSVFFSHYLLFRLCSHFYIEQGLVMYHFYIMVAGVQDIENVYFFYAIAISVLSFIVHVIGNSNIVLYGLLLTEYSKIFFDNFMLFSLLILFSFSYAAVAVFLLMFKTTSIESVFVNSVLFLTLLWILDWIIALVEIWSTSVTMFYLINRNSESQLFTVSNTFTNVYYCLGNISIGKMYFYFYNTYVFMQDRINSHEDIPSEILTFIVFLPLYLIKDLVCFFSHSLREYVLPYIGIYNSSYAKAVRNTNNILFENMYIRLFDNIYLKNIHNIIFIMMLPFFTYVQSLLICKGLDTESIDGLKIIFYTSFMAYFLWKILYSTLYTIGSTMNYVVVLFPNLLLNT
ncbi:hypothetical protein NGRA_1041 [Nosema granulosis]|uniref:Uncharacterized protein n=1 Tax=Nosema granulosis TaxID=83296 RepID=A0A9P6GZ59_9MICR|nr:hypothetical protein NGRA_1041 [Nosema granulosis]